MLRLINQLLDLSKLETGKMRLQASPGDFVSFLKGLAMSFESLAERKGIDLQFIAEPCESRPEASHARQKKVWITIRNSEGVKCL